MNYRPMKNRQIGTIRSKGGKYAEAVEEPDYYDDEPIDGVDI